MPSYLQAVAILLVFLVLWGGWSLRKENLKEYFSTHDGKGILKGIVIVVVLFASIALLTGCSSGTFFNDASIFAGLDYTKKVSPQCAQGGVDDHSTSNVGLDVNAYRSNDGRATAGAKLTHHSCAFGRDSKSYDALGAYAEYKFWSRW